MHDCVCDLGDGRDPRGVYAAVKRYSLFDSGLTIFNYVGYSLPTFWLGIMLITFFAVPPLRWFPASGMNDVYTTPAFGTSDYWAFFGSNPFFAIFDLGRHLVLPVLTLVTVSIAGDSRFVRSSMLDSLNQDYVKTARAKGVPERRVILRHALRNALLPVITNVGLEIPFLFSGAIVTETIFAWPGMAGSSSSRSPYGLPGVDGHPAHRVGCRSVRQSAGRYPLRGGRSRVKYD